MAYPNNSTAFYRKVSALFLIVSTVGIIKMQRQPPKNQKSDSGYNYHVVLQKISSRVFWNGTNYKNKTLHIIISLGFKYSSKYSLFGRTELKFLLGD